MLGIFGLEVHNSVSNKYQKKNSFKLYFLRDMEKNGQWIDTILSEDQNERKIDFDLHEDERLRIVVFITLKCYSFNQESVMKKILKRDDEEISLITSDDDNY